MTLLNDLPTDSVLRRHALAERQRVLGLPPTDSVLRRHYLQWTEAQQAAPAPARVPQAAARVAAPANPPAPAPARAPAPAVAAVPAPQRPAMAAPTAAASTTSSGGFWAWLSRIFGN